MARGRMINQSIALDPEFNALGAEAQLVYLRCIPHLDRDGLMLGNPAGLWGRVAPLMESLLPRMPSIIEEWIGQGLVTRYSCKSGPVLFFHGFRKNQGGIHYNREATSFYPPPPGFIRTDSGLVENDSAGNTPEQVRTNSGLTPDEVPLKLNRNKTNTTTNAPNDVESHSRRGSRSDAAAEFERTQGLVIANKLVDKWTEGAGVTVAGWLSAYAHDWIPDAIQVAVDANHLSLAYVTGILRNWKQEGRAPPLPRNGAGQVEFTLEDVL